MHTRGPSLVVLLAFVLATSAAPVAASDDPAIGESAAGDPAPGDPEVLERLRFLHDRLEADRGHGRIWQRGWPALYSVGAVYSVAMGIEDEVPARRADQLISAALSVGGVIDLMIPNFTHAQEGADDLLGLPDGTPAERRRKLARAEGLLRRNAAESERRYDVLRHVMTVAVPLASFLFVGLYYDEWERSAVTLATSVAVGEVTIWTQPWQAEDDLAEYERRFPEPIPTDSTGGESADDESVCAGGTDGAGGGPTWRIVPSASGVWVLVGF